MSYGFFGPLASRMEFLGAAEMAFFRTITTVILAFVNDVPPKVAIEQARRGVGTEVRPDAARSWINCSRKLKEWRRDRAMPNDQAPMTKNVSNSLWSLDFGDAQSSRIWSFVIRTSFLFTLGVNARQQRQHCGGTRSNGRQRAAALGKSRTRTLSPR